MRMLGINAKIGGRGKKRIPKAKPSPSSKGEAKVRSWQQYFEAQPT